MKSRVYSISLLLSFLIVLSHEMIPHHHQDMDDSGLWLLFDFSKHHHHTDDADHHHHGEEKHSHETEKKRQQSFPFHQHLSTDNGFDYLRIELKKDSNAAFRLVAVLFTIGTFKIAPPPEIDLIRFTDKPFLIPIIFKPGAIGLRAPPSIA